ncbi:mannose-1-phosphate guanylyltransferase/mannose-6-phosphate isomerase [Amylibacter sp.]|nr:mannose-1-phosphate guanylyltransferase/mannose-6-phosphate isomerase [Amylibacter sp.]
MKKITPVILCGGSGTRLWPLSRKSYPKQFAKLFDGKTLFQKSAQRLSGPLFDDPIIVTNSDFRFIVTEQLQEVGINPGSIIIEPEGRNTAPAILAAAQLAINQNSNTTLLIAPSDHVIKDINAFHSALIRALEMTKLGQLVTFGINPTHPETAYGYLELTQTANEAPVALNAFVEKPNINDAKKMYMSGNYLWNAGIFLFEAKDIISAYTKHAPKILAAVSAANETSTVDLGFLRLGSKAWATADNISIDYAIMEKANNISVVPFNGGWSDLGGWDAVWREEKSVESNVVTFGEATAIDCTNSLIRSENNNLEIVAIGLENIIAIAMNDAVLVADMSRAQDVKQAVEKLKLKQAPQATNLPKDYRPWGWFESLVICEEFQVKRIFVNPGAALSLQSHKYRAEHWIVVSGIAEVTIDKEVMLVKENQSTYIPLGAVHRMKNPGKKPMVLIEIQTGSYFGEDDIVRYDDIYARGQGPNG